MSITARLIAMGAAVALFASLLFGAYLRGVSTEREKWGVKLAGDAAVAKAVTDGWRSTVKEIRDANAQEVTRIAAERDRALGELRKRADRLPEASRAACEGATGAELSRPDGQFLVGEAARADELRAALQSCQAWVGAVTGGGAVPIESDAAQK